jgi:D-serine deaminase-like pyridoxal phosphate-dependent protein
VQVTEIPTPAPVVDRVALEANLSTMAAARPGAALRPHVKAHKCTELARRQAAHGHLTFTCATPREVLGMAAAGLGDDLLLANEVLDPARLRALARCDARVTVAVDSEATTAAAARAGIAEVVIDVNVGLPRCGCEPAAAGRLADLARRAGLTVRGVMGYEGHLMMVEPRTERKVKVDAAMDLLVEAHRLVGGDVVSAGGTGTYDLHDRVTDVQAGSYALMDSQYQRLGMPFRQALTVIGTVIAAPGDWLVADVGLKALAMDHGNPTITAASAWFFSDEHVTFAPDADGPLAASRAGDRVRVVPAHVDPTLALHERLYVVEGDAVVDTWPIDLRGW